MAEGFTLVPTTPEAGRYQAQHFYEAKACSECGKTGPRLHRHHRDGNPMNNAPTNIEVLCAQCHATEHRSEAPLSSCAVCQTTFLAKSSAYSWKMSFEGHVL